MGALRGARYSDMCAYRAISRVVLRRLDMGETTYDWSIETQMNVARSGLRILEISTPCRRRIGIDCKIAGSLCGSVKASCQVATTILYAAKAIQNG